MNALMDDAGAPVGKLWTPEKDKRRKFEFYKNEDDDSLTTVECEWVQFNPGHVVFLDIRDNKEYIILAVRNDVVCDLKEVAVDAEVQEQTN